MPSLKKVSGARYCTCAPQRPGISSVTGRVIASSRSELPNSPKPPSSGETAFTNEISTSSRGSVNRGANGVVEKIPRLHGVQSAACSPIYTAHSEDGKIKRTPQTYETLAEGIAAEYPIRGEMILDAQRETDGAFTVVSEEDIKTGIKVLAAKGIYVEPTSAVVVKAFDRFEEGGIIGRCDTVVSILTGSGLKATEKLMKIL